MKQSGSKCFIPAQLTWRPHRSLPAATASIPKPLEQVCDCQTLRDLQMAPIPFQYSQLNTIPFHFVSRLVCITKRIWKKWQHVTFEARSSRHCGFCLAFAARVPEKTNCCIERTLKQLSGKVRVVRNEGLLPTDSKNLRPLAYSCVSEPSWKQPLQPQGNLQDTAAPGVLTASSRETLS